MALEAILRANRFLLVDSITVGAAAFAVCAVQVEVEGTEGCCMADVEALEGRGTRWTAVVVEGRVVNAQVLGDDDTPPTRVNADDDSVRCRDMEKDRRGDDTGE